MPFVPSATYHLVEVQRLIAEGQFYITTAALDGAFALGFDDQSIRECICDFLDDTHFYKTMVAEKGKPGLMQDVYRITYESQPIYLKLQICNKQAVVISFKAE